MCRRFVTRQFVDFFWTILTIETANEKRNSHVSGQRSIMQATITTKSEILDSCVMLMYECNRPCNMLSVASLRYPHHRAPFN